MSIKSIGYADDTIIVTVKIGKERIVGNAQLDNTVEKKNSFFNITKNTYQIDGVAIYGGIVGNLTQDELNFDGKTYSHLKIVFDYDTINKSTKSNGDLSKDGKHFVHSFVLDDGQNNITLERETPNTAVWYETLIGCAVALMIIVATIVALKGKYGREKDEN
ncbi:MAG: hypothetical protein MJ193_03190 [Clostridia bacterium]|nr:hypothetical protein [Clostridia bacterium]